MDTSKRECSVSPQTARVRSSRPYGLRLVFTMVALGVVLWVFEVDLLVQVAKRATNVLPALNSSIHRRDGAGHVNASVPATPALRSKELLNTTQGSVTNTTSATTNLTEAQAKQCVEINMNHVEKAFYRKDLCLSRSDIQRIIFGLVWTLADVFKRYSVPYWIDSGTLLGAYREKTVIPYDGDADIGITEASYFQLRGNQFEYPSETYDLQVLGGKFHRSGPRDANIPARFIHKHSGLYVDIFVFLDNKKDPKMFGPVPSVCFASCHRCPQLAGWRREFTIPRDWVYPLQECAFGGKNVSCPAKPELYLDHLFGPNFMTPDKNSAR